MTASYDITAPTADTCPECGDLGYLVDQTYGHADVPVGWLPVQRCDICGGGPAELDDEGAAMCAAADRDDIDHRVHFAWFPGGDDDDDQPLPGDWAIGPGL